MFSLIRGVIIVGLIFYFSPERDIIKPEQQARGGERTPAPTVPSPEDRDIQDGLWNRIVASLTEEVVRTTVNGTAQEAGLRLKEGAGQSVRCVYRCDGSE